MPFSRSTKNGLFIVWTENPIRRPPLAPPPPPGWVALPAPPPSPLSQPASASDAAVNATAQIQRAMLISRLLVVPAPVARALRAPGPASLSRLRVRLDGHLVN